MHTHNTVYSRRRDTLSLGTSSRYLQLNVPVRRQDRRHEITKHSLVSALPSRAPSICNLFTDRGKLSLLTFSRFRPATAALSRDPSSRRKTAGTPNVAPTLRPFLDASSLPTFLVSSTACPSRHHPTPHPPPAPSPPAGLCAAHRRRRCRVLESPPPRDIASP